MGRGGIVLGFIAFWVLAWPFEAAGQEPEPAQDDPTSSTRAPSAPPAPSGVQDLEKPFAHFAPNSFYFEALGAAAFYSLNYDRILFDRFAVRVGFSYMTETLPTPGTGPERTAASALQFPFTVSYVGVRSGPHAFEAGVGATLVYVDAGGSAFGVRAAVWEIEPYGTVMAGYRLQPLDRGFQFRAGLAGLFRDGMSYSNGDPSTFGFVVLPYLSLGGAF